ncbi:hypothetical protein [Shewanella pealeana]|uniref:Uncharacterized protein n=1 Tax=Shewanella pealeana (strain ATCC 700345 / ANG-SQ1) TaxID=398579 RepID=A8H6H7_SHEPA|nr:hypothetical protein [Shewanella pealeana]ABV88164.1 hypothetical protein Spea_2846 [Shewanella pealeana ATCC 700345]
MTLVTIYYDTAFRFECELNIDYLKLGDAIYVNENTKEVALHPKKKFEKYYIGHIAKKSCVIQVHDGSLNIEGEVDYIFGELNGHFVENKVSKNVVQKSVMYSANKIRSKQLHKTRELECQQFRKWVRVLNRMDLCRILMNPDVGRGLSSHWSPLIEYHCLTCFDLLGQKERYTDFGGWIKGSKYKSERDNVLIPTNTAQDKIAELYHSEYQRLYGVKNSFFNFIDNILDKNHLNELLNSIRIYQNGINDDTSEFGNEADKKKYLYEVRNLYTHNLEAQFGVHPDSFPSGIPNAWNCRKQIINQGSFNTYAVYGWPNTLINTVMNGLKRQIEQYSEYN